MFGGWEIVVILCLILLLFGGKRFPELARNLGKGLREFKRATREVHSEIELEEREESTVREVSDAP